jgi:RNA polymerase sigma-70 factor (ECF subfamily)
VPDGTDSTRRPNEKPDPVTAVAADHEPSNGTGAKRVRSQDVDANLVEGCQRGDHAAMEALYRRYKRRVFGLVTRIVGPSDAEEVAQDVFVRIFRGLGKFRGDSAVGTWIYRLSVNTAITYATKRNRRRGLGEEALDTVPAPAPPSRDPRLAERLERAMAQLSPGYRAILVLHDIDGMSHEECAAIMGCRVGTSKSQLHKARARMRALLGDDLERERREH